MWRMIAWVFLSLISVAAPAQAYIGPGAAITLFGTFLGFTATVVLGVVFTLAWPCWILYKRHKAKKQAVEQQPTEPSDE